MMKKLKKKSRKKTIEAYACDHCGDPSVCVANCAGNIPNLSTNAWVFAGAIKGAV